MQLCLGAFIWELCTNINNRREENKLNLALIVPIEEEVVQETIKEVMLLPEPEPQEMQPNEMALDEIIPIDPFEQPMIIEKPVIPKEEPKPQKKPKAIRKDSPKIVKEEKKEEIVEELPKHSDQVINETKSVSLPTEQHQKEAKPIPVKRISKPLTQRQQNENSKYLAKIMKIFEKNKVYPVNARFNHIEGKILISFCIDESGKTSKITVITKNPAILADAAEEIVKKAKLPPPPKHWDIKNRIELPINYNLR